MELMGRSGGIRDEKKFLTTRLLVRFAAKNRKKDIILEFFRRHLVETTKNTKFGVKCMGFMGWTLFIHIEV